MAEEEPDQREFALMTFDEADAEVQRQIDNCQRLADEERRDYGPHVNTKAFNIATWRRVGLEDAQRVYRQAFGSATALATKPDAEEADWARPAGCKVLAPRADGWNFDMTQAPRDHGLVQLLMLYDWSDEADDNGNGFDTEETPCLSRTIGCNGFDHTGQDEWFYAGWDWNGDEFERGSGGTPIAWQPMAAQVSIEQLPPEVRARVRWAALDDGLQKDTR